MAFASVGSVGTGQAKSTGSTLVITTGATIPAGNLALIAYATDNIATADGETNVVTGIADDAGNTWTRIYEYTNTSGAAGDGALASIWYTVATTQLDSGETITVTQSGNTGARAGSVWQYTTAGGVTLEDVAANGGETTTPPDISLAGMTSREYLLFHGLGVEGPNSGSYTEDSDYTSITGDGTSGGGGATNISIRGGFRIATLTDDTVSTAIGNNTTTAHVLAALYEAGGGTEYEQGVAGTLTSAGGVLKRTAVSKAGTLTSAGALMRQAQKSLSGTLTSAGIVARQAQKTLAGTLTTAGALVRQAQKAVAGTLTSSGTLAAAKTALLTLSGTLTSAGTLTRRTGKPVAGTLTSDGNLIRQGQKAVAGVLSSAGVLSRSARKTLAGTLSSSGTLASIKSALVFLAGTLTSAGTVARQTGKGVAGILTSAGSLTRRTAKALAGVLTSAGALTASFVGPGTQKLETMFRGIYRGLFKGMR